MKHNISKRILSTLLALVMVIGLIPVATLTVSAAVTTVTTVYATVPTPLIGGKVGYVSYGHSGTPGVTVTDVNWTDINGAIYSDDHRFQQGVTYYCDVEFQVKDGYTFPASYTQLKGYINNQAGEISTVYYTDHAYATVGMKPKVTGDVYVGGVGIANNRYYSVLTGAITTDKPDDNYVHYKDGVLTMHNFTYKGLGMVLPGDYSKYSVGIYSEKPLTIVPEGENTIEVSDKAAKTMGIYVFNNDLSITGTANAKLTLSGSYVSSLSDKLTIDGGSYVLTSDSYALYARSDCQIQNCNLKITSTGAGIYTSTNLSLNNVDANILAETHHALYADNKISVSGCDFSIETGDSGLCCAKAQVESSTLDVTAYDSGIEIWGEDSTIKNCFISIEGKYGIYIDNGDLSIEGCTISIEALKSGIMTYYSDLYITDCRITAYSSTGDALTALDGSVFFGEGVSARATTEANGAWVPYISNDAKYYYCVDVHKHLSDGGAVTKKATCTATGIKTYKCTICNEVIKTETIAKTNHTYESKTTKATLSKNGKIENKCSVCGVVKSTTTIKYAKTFKLSTTTYTYNGKAKTPSVTVKDSAGKTLKLNTDYTVTYTSGRKNVGTYKVTIKMKGKYSGTKTLSFKIIPAKTSISKITAAKKALTVKWSKKTTQVTGYQIQYSTSKSFKSYKTKTVTKNSTTSLKLSSLSAKKTYYIRVRTYKTVNGTKYYSGWSTVKSKKTK